MRVRLDLTTRFPVMKVLVDFDNVGYGYMENWTDITEYVSDISGSKEKENEVLGGVSSDLLTLTVDNSENSFSVDNPNSYFYGKSKSKLRFALQTGFQGETLTDYVVGYIYSMQPKWKGKEYLLKATCPMERLKRANVPTQSFYNVSWDELVIALLDQAGIEPYFLRNIPKTSLFYKYFKFEESKCFDALKKLMEVVAGQAFFDGRNFTVTTKLALDYTEDRTAKHDIRAEDFFEFDEVIDDSQIINKVSIESEPKEIAPLQVIWETPDNFVKVSNEQVNYDGTDYVYIDADNKPIYWEDGSEEITIKNLTNGMDVEWDLYNAELGRIHLTATGKANCNPGDLLSVSYTYQYLVLLPGQSRTYNIKTDDVIDTILEPDVTAWNADATAQVPYSSAPDTVNSLSRQSLVKEEDGSTFTLVLKNNTADKVSISTLQLRGYPVKVLNPIEVYNKSQPSIDEYDIKENNITNNYINNVRLAEKLSQFIVDNYSEIKKQLNVQINGYSELLLSDVALVTESSSGTNHLMTIENINFAFNVNNGWTADLSLREIPTSDWVYGGFDGDSYSAPQKGVTEAPQPYFKGNTPPTDTTLFWVDTSVTPNATKVYDNNTGTWVKTTPTTPAEIGAETPQGAQDKADQAKQDAIDSANGYTDTEVSTRELAVFKQATIPSNPVADQLWIDTSTTPFMIKKWDGTTWETIGPAKAEDIGAVPQVTYDNDINDGTVGLKVRLDSAETNISQNATDISLRVTQTTYDADINDATNGLKVRLSSAESNISQNANNITLKVDQTTYDIDVPDLQSRMSTAESSITQNATDITLKVDVDGVISSINQTAETIKIEASKIELTGAVSLSDFNTTLQSSFNGKADQTYVDSIQYQGKNLIKNSTFKYLEEKLLSTDPDILTEWTNPDPAWTIQPPESDKPESYILSASATGLTGTAIKSVYSNKFIAHTGETFTFAIDFKVTSASAWDVKNPFIAEFYDSTGARIQYHDVSASDLGVSTIADNTWYRGAFTITTTDPNIVSGGIRLTLFENGELFIREVKVERGIKDSEWTPYPGDAENQLDLLSTRVSNAEIKLDDNSIISTVLSSTTFDNAMASKADSSKLGDYSTKTEVDNKINAIDFDGKIDGRIDSLTTDPNSKLNTTFASKTELSETSDNLTAKFQKSGGINKIKNSVGYAGKSFWNEAYGETGEFTVSNDTLSSLGFGSGFYFPADGGNKGLYQDISVDIGVPYMLSWYLNKTTSGDSTYRFWLQIQEFDGTNWVTKYSLPDNSATKTTGYKYDYTTYIPTSSVIRIRIIGYANCEATVTGLMLNEGNIALKWTMAPGEIYNTNVRMDLNGVHVSQYDANGKEVGYTIMSPDEFAGFYDSNGDGNFEKVFYLQEDETVSKKFRAEEEFTMGSLKIISVQAGGNDGWAFVPIVQQ